MVKSSSNFRFDNVRYFTLTKQLDLILQHFNHDIRIICNPNIHITRNHPEYLGCWKNVLFKARLTFIDKLSIFIDLVNIFFQTSVSILFELIKLKSNRLHSKNDGTSRLDFLLISHQVENMQNTNDFYFGNLQGNLTRSGKKVFRLLIPHSNSLTSSTRGGEKSTLILENSMKKSDLLIYVFSNLYSFAKLTLFLINNKFGFYESVHILTGQIKSFSLYRLAVSIKYALEELKPERVIFTFEGNALEKAVFSLCSRLHTVSYGYQHAPIIQSQNSIFQLYPVNLSPDIILCSGDYTRDKFRHFLGENRQVFILGSPKFIKYREKFSLNRLTKSVLLIPDGNTQSILTFIDLGIFLARSDSSRNIIIRSHPLFEEFLETKLNSDIQISDLNIRLSKDDIFQDLTSSRWLIYQNSSVCIQGLLTGCKLIYFEHPLANINPLWEFPDTHFSAQDFLDINNFVEFKGDLPIEVDLEHLSSGQTYFAKFNPDLFSD